MSNCAIHVKNSQLQPSVYLKHLQVKDHNLDRKDGLYTLDQRVYCRKTVKNRFYRTYAYYNFAGWEARFKCDALKHGASQLNQRKIGKRPRLCFDGLDSAMLQRDYEQHGQNGERP